MYDARYRGGGVSLEDEEVTGQDQCLFFIR